MEIRHIHRAARRRGRRSRFSPAVLLLVAVFLAVAYLVGASKLGTWLATRVAAPLFTAVTAELTPTPSIVPITIATLAPEKETMAVSLPAISCYAIQIGVYAEKANAEAQSQRLRELGAAGYMYEDDSRYRVLAAGYPDRDSMEKVRAQLLSEGIDSRSYEILTDGLRLRVSGTSAQIEALESALSFAGALSQRLFDIAIRFDRDGQSVSEGAAAAAELCTQCSMQADALVRAESEEDLFSPLIVYLDDLGSALDDIAKKDTEKAAEISSSLKQLYLESIIRYQRISKEMGLT